MGQPPPSFDQLAERSLYPPYAIARKVEAEYFEALRPPPRRPVMRSDIDQLSVEQLLSVLAEMGVQLAESEFVAAARGERSAWVLSRRWRTNIPVTRGHEHHFVALAVCSLWERWCSETPSMEMVDDWMREGYSHLEEGKEVAPYEEWLRVWEVLREWIRPELRTLHAAEEAFRGTHFLFNWFQDFALYASNAARLSPPEGKRVATAIREFLERFPDEEPDILRSLRKDLARVQFALGEHDDARAILDALIAEDPRACGPYAELADELAFHPRTPSDVHEALQVLLRAKEALVTDGPDYDLEARIEDVRELQTKAAEARPTTSDEVG